MAAPEQSFHTSQQPQRLVRQLWPSTREPTSPMSSQADSMAPRAPEHSAEIADDWRHSVGSAASDRYNAGYAYAASERSSAGIAGVVQRRPSKSNVVIEHYSAAHGYVGSERPSAGIATMSERPSAGLSDRPSTGSTSSHPPHVFLARKQLREILTDVRSVHDLPAMFASGLPGKDLEQLGQMNPTDFEKLRLTLDLLALQTEAAAAPPTTQGNSMAGADEARLHGVVALEHAAASPTNVPPPAPVSPVSSVCAPPGHPGMLAAPAPAHSRQGIDELRAAVRTLECRVQEIITDLSSQAARIASLERVDSASRKAHSAAFRALQEGQEELRAKLNSGVAAMESGMCSPADSHTRSLEEDANEPSRILLELIRDEAVQMADMLENLKQEKLEVIRAMHGFQINKQLALTEMTEAHNSHMEAVAEFWKRNKESRNTADTSSCGSSRVTSSNSSHNQVQELRRLLEKKNSGGDLNASLGKLDSSGLRLAAEAVASHAAAANPSHAVPAAMGTNPATPAQTHREADEIAAVAAWKAMAAVPAGGLAPCTVRGTTGSSRFGEPLARRNRTNLDASLTQVAAGTVSTGTASPAPSSTAAVQSGGTAGRPSQ